jgi:D-alanyl-D-alanine carboxypeptidase (penicillin-binding protein 5/6)
MPVEYVKRGLAVRLFNREGHFQSDRQHRWVESQRRSTTINVMPKNAMQTKTFSILPVIFAIAAGALVPGSASFAARHHATKPASPKKAAAAVNALPPLAAQTTLASNPPALPAKAWLLMDSDSGEVLASANADEPLPPASLTKMMTSYLVEQALRSGKLKRTDLVSVSQNAWCRGSSTESCMYLPLNSQATVIDILRGIIIQSGNDASKAIAEHMAGSEEGFAKLMNAEAQRLGMAHTHFVNATGLPDPEHKSSARDLAILARAIIRDSVDYYPIYAEREFKYNGIKQGNRNALLYTDPSVDGLKTGHTEAAGYCLVTSSKRNDMRLITVILNTNSAQVGLQQLREGHPDSTEHSGHDGQGQLRQGRHGRRGSGSTVDADGAARPASADLGGAQAGPGGAGDQGLCDRQGGRDFEG